MYRTRRRPRHRLRWPAIALPLLICLISPLFSGAPAPPVRATEQAQSAARLFLPLVTRPGPPPGAPAIDAFQLSRAAGPMAAEVLLSWQVRGATQIRVDPRPGPVTGTSLAVYPVETTTYVLTATNDKGSVTATATYTVDALPVPSPLTVAARPDTGRAAAASIGPAGGMLEATGSDGTRYTLAVPPEALVHTEVITLTPAAAIDGTPFDASGLRAATIAPEGLLFIDPATLTITPPSGGGPLVGFAYEGTGAEFHLRELERPSGAIAVITARSYGTAPAPSRSQLSSIARAFPSNPIDAVEHTLTTAAIDSASLIAALQGATSGQSPPPAALGQYVQSRLRDAAQSPDKVDGAVWIYTYWRKRIAGREDSYSAQIAEFNQLLGEALQKAGALATERCNQGRPAQGFALQRYMAYAKRFGLVNTRADLEDRLRKCWVFDLTFTSRMDQITEDIFGRYELSAAVRLAYRSGGQIVGSGPLTWANFEVTIPQDCTMTTSHDSSTFRADGEGMGLSLAPVSRTSPDISFSLSYQVGEPTANWTVTCPEQPPVAFSSPVWYLLYEDLHSDERNGDTFTALASPVNPSGFSGWVYDNALGDHIIEHTEIDLKHAPRR